jgi:SAM-dependent methyltransferase
MADTSAFFDSRAPVYDALRPQDEAWWARFEAMVRLGDLRGRRVLDVGCGTGTLLLALAEKANAKVWGVEPSSEMRATAKERLPRGVGLRAGSAEALPFRDGWFDAVTFSLVIHLVDRKAAFAEVARVLAPTGRIVIASFSHDHFDTYWAAPFFPSIPEIDRARFPTEAQLDEELAAAGFGEICQERLSSRYTTTRDHALERIHGRHISTFHLLDPAEVEAGAARAEKELPAEVEVRLEQLVVAAQLGT